MKTNNEVMSAKNNTKPITAYNLYDFSVGIQEAVLEGYRLSTDNQNFPVQLGPSLYTAVLIKEEQEEQTKKEPEVVAENATNVVESATGVPQKETEDKPKGRTRKVSKE